MSRIPSAAVREECTTGGSRRASRVVALLFALGACQSTIGDAMGPAPDRPGATAHPPPRPGPLDVNRVDLHRLNNAEYDNTMRDLLGVATTPAATFIEDEKLLGFDNIASALGMTDARYEQFFNAAEALVEQVFADPALRNRILVCAPLSPADTDCAKKIIAAFGQRAWRRPLSDGETNRLVTLAADAVALGEDFPASIKQVVKAMLSSVPFLYRVELDADPTSALPHALDPYELATRLSYLVWSTMPDDELLRLAAGGVLLDDARLSDQLERLLSDTRAARFLRSFGGQWLGLRDLANHQVEPTAFPAWNDPLRAAMVEEGFSFLGEFLTLGRPITEFFTAEINFPNAPLADLYGIAGISSSTAVRVSGASSERRGFLGLAGFLTQSSYSYRTAPTLRGKWVLENLLCQDIPPPPPNVPQLDPVNGSSSPDIQSENVRARLEAHRAMPACASCHTILDPIGLGLENFDAIGHYRTTYANGDVIDASGVLPDGTTFEGLSSLAGILARDARFADCASLKMMTYALSRPIGDTDAPYLQQIRDEWRSQGLGLAALLERIVQSDTFRYRRGEPM